jgi:LysM repeat protein
MITQDELKQLVNLKREGPTLDYKQDLNLEKDRDKAAFIKDVLALANSGTPSYIVTGMKEIIKGDAKTWEPANISKNYTQVQLNQILQYRTDPPISVEYTEIELNSVTHGIVKISGDNPPYLVMVKDKFGVIQKGTVFIRNVDMNEGARRTDLDQMYSKVDLRLSHNIKEQKVINDAIEVNVAFILRNIGRMSATFVRLTVQFNNIERILSRSGGWQDISHLRNNVPTIQLDENVVHLDERLYADGAVLRVGKDTKQVEALVSLYATNMQRKKDVYVISLENK